MNRPVIYVKTHSSIHFPGIGDFGSTLTPKGGVSKTEEFRMKPSDVGIIVTARGKDYVIPYANIQVFEVGPDVSKKNSTT